MTLTINPKIYGDLLAQYQPKIITTEEENERAIAVVESLTHKSDLTPEEDQLLELLITLIEKFETEHYPLNNLSTSLSRLTFLMEENNLRQADLIEIFGSKGNGTKISGNSYPSNSLPLCSILMSRLLHQRISFGTTFTFLVVHFDLGDRERIYEQLF
jgi:HTH-type transcriptional regulator / antitoxin HigA